MFLGGLAATARTRRAATLVATRVPATEDFLNLKLSEFVLMTVGKDWKVETLGRQLAVCPHDAAAAIFEHGLLVSLEEFFRTIVTFEDTAWKQAAAASESEFETEGETGPAPLWCNCSKKMN